MCPLKLARVSSNESERKGGLLADMSSPAYSSILLWAQVLVTTLLPSTCRVLSMFRSPLSNMSQRKETLPSQALRMLCAPQRETQKDTWGSNMFVIPNRWWVGFTCSPRYISNTKGRETAPDRFNISGDSSPCYVVHIMFRSCLRTWQSCAHCKYVDDPKRVTGELLSSHWL